MSESENQPPPFLFRDISISESDIQATPWAAVLSDKDLKRVEMYSSLFAKAADVAVKENNIPAAQVYVLLGAATSMYGDNSDGSEPLKPMVVYENGRSVALADFEANHLDPMKGMLSDVSDNALRARLADILWIRRKDHESARIALNAYLLVAKDVMDPERWPDGFMALERSLQIASSLGKETPERKAVVDYATGLLVELAGNDPLYLSNKLIELLLDHKAAEPDVLAVLAERSAANAETREEFMIAANCWALARSCRIKANDLPGAKQDSLHEGEAYVQIGLGMEGNPALAATHWIERGLVTLQQAGLQPTASEDYRPSWELQEKQLENFTEVSSSVPVDPKIIEYVERVKGMEFEPAVAFLAQIFRFSTKTELKKQVEKTNKDHVFTSLFGNSFLREDGKKDFILPPLPRDKEPDEGILNFHLWNAMQFSLPYPAWMVGYVLRIIADEHPWEEHKLDWLLKDNTFVPKGREEIFERGLRAGLEGDFLVASHLLLPQLENSFRYILNQHGEATSFLRQDGTEDEYSLNKIVGMDGFTKIFGEDIAFGLRGLLVERAGQNVRNNVAHGLYSANSFYSPPHLLLVPISLFLLLHGRIRPEEPDVPSTD